MFTAPEVGRLLFASFVLSFCLALPFSPAFPGMLLIALLTAGLGFICHEVAHKLVAQRRGFVAEFKLWGTGLILALLTAFITGGFFIFAALGAVYLIPTTTSWSEREEAEAEIALAGPVMNMVLAGAFWPLYILTEGFLSQIGLYGAIINSWLAALNLLPFGPLDGHKVLHRDATLWILISTPAWMMMTYFLFAR